MQYGIARRHHPGMTLNVVACIALLAAPSPSEARLREIESFLTNLEGFGFSGSVLLLKDDEEVLSKGYGLANRQLGYRNEIGTIYDIASMSKSFTAVATLRLVEAGRLGLDEPISKYLKGVPTDKQAITVRQLLSHTAGLDSDFPFKVFDGTYFEDVGKDEALRRILEVPLIQEPGKGYSYSNIGYVLLAGVVEEVAGKAFQEVIRDEVLEPVGLTQSGFRGSGMPAAPEHLIAIGYEADRKTEDPRTISGSSWHDMGGGGMVSTARDVSKFLTSLVQGKLLSEEMLKLLWTAGDGNYGLGWTILSKPRKVMIAAGNHLGFASRLSWYPEEKLTLVALANSAEDVIGMNHVVGAIVPQIWFGADYRRVFSNEAFSMPPPSKAFSREGEESLVGVYRFAGSTLTIKRGTRGLAIGATGQAAVNVLLGADEKESALMSGLSEKIVAALEELTQGGSSLLKACMRDDDPELFNGYLRPFNRLLRGWDEDKLGRIHSVRSLGTAPSGFPRGSYSTTLLFKFDKGERRLRVGWNSEGRILNMGTAVDGDLYTVRLRSGEDSTVVGWSLSTFRTFRATPVKGGIRVTLNGKPIVVRRG
jgi:CubicO group peptidase (beta-lactamase class C family)